MPVDIELQAQLDAYRTLLASKQLLVTANEELAFQNEEKEKRAAELVIANTELVYQNGEKEKRAAELVIANTELAFQNEEKEKRAAELVIANTELVFHNEEKEKRAAELVIANTELVFHNEEKEKRAAELVIANIELVFQNGEKGKRADELVIANTELVFQNEEKEKRAAELVIANIELVFQNGEKEKRANELVIANTELVYQSGEKEKRAAELVIANIELVFQNGEKGKRADELVIANTELVFQNEEKEKRAAELVIANIELVFHNEEKGKRADELVIANIELAFQNEEKEKRAAELVIANIELVFQNEEKEKRAAELVITLNSVMQDEEDKEVLFVMNPNAIVVVDSNGKVSGINPAFGQMFNVNESTLIGLSEGEFDDFIQEKCTDKNQYLATSSLPINAGLKAKQSISAAKTDKLDFEINLDGIKFISRSYIDCNITRISRIVHFQDVTERTLVDRMKSEFITTAAHELRTPMTTIFGYTELLKDVSLVAEVQKDVINTIHAQSKLMIVLLNDILDIAKIEAQAANLYQIKLQPIEPILESLANTFITPENHNKVVFEISPNLPDLNIDQTKIEQVVRNVLSNAYKFSPNNDEINMRVSEIMHEGVPKVLIAIQDHGIGMKPDEQCRVYEKFYRADQSGLIPGTGLGMAIVADIIKYHGGSIEIESEYGVGTTVSLYLPIA